MKISSKIESFNKIKELNINKLPEKIFKTSDIEDIKEFLKTYPAKYYAIRDKSKAGGVFKLKVETKDVFNEISDYNLFSINVSSYNYVENQLLVGEILITDTNVSAILSTNGGYSVRDAIRNPDFNFTTNIFDDRLLNQIPSFNKVYKYIIEHNLKNIIVEFSYFDIPVGINNENIVVYELRTHY